MQPAITIAITLIKDKSPLAASIVTAAPGATSSTRSVGGGGGDRGGKVGGDTGGTGGEGGSGGAESTLVTLVVTTEGVEITARFKRVEARLAFASVLTSVLATVLLFVSFSVLIRTVSVRLALATVMLTLGRGTEAKSAIVDATCVLVASSKSSMVPSMTVVKTVWYEVCVLDPGKRGGNGGGGGT